MSTEHGEKPRQPDEPASTPMQPAGQSRGRMLLFESTLIVLSVLLGFSLQAWGERRANARIARAAIESFRAEIQTNLNTLQRVQPKHAEFAERLAEAIVDSTSRSAETAFDVFARTMPEGGLDTPPLREAAWETAMSTGALSLLDYDLAAVLSETYLIQRSTLAPTLALLRERLIAPANFESREHRALLRVHQMMLNELAGQEAYLIDVYGNALARLSEADR